MVESIRFIPIGEESLGYKVTTAQKSLFVKYCDKPEVIQNINAIHRLLDFLATLNLEFVIPPIKINGATEIPISQGIMYAYPFIDSKPIKLANDKFDKDTISKLIMMINQLQSIDTRSLPKATPVETFDYRFRQRLQSLLKKHGSSALNKFLSDRLSNLSDAITRFEKDSADYRKKADIKMVLTHGDITGLNILKKQGNLVLVDWDGAMIAPPERDINFINDDQYFSVKEFLTNSKLDEIDNKLIHYYGDAWSIDCIIENLEKLFDYNEGYGNKEAIVEDINDYMVYYT